MNTLFPIRGNDANRSWEAFYEFVSIIAPAIPYTSFIYDSAGSQVQNMEHQSTKIEQDGGYGSIDHRRKNSITCHLL